jgi:hypothetical protein
MLVVFEVHLAPGGVAAELLSEEILADTHAKVMTAAEAHALGFAGVSDDPAVRLVAVEKRDAQWIQRALERSPAAGPFRVHEVGG